MNRILLHMKWLLCATIITLCAQQLSAQVSVSATGGSPAAGYTTLKDAFDAINNGTHQGSIGIQLTANTTETASAVLQASGTGSASYVTVSIMPSGGATRTISGSLAAPLIDLNGADSVIIDGLNTGGNSLEISNASTSGSALRFINDASRNTITNATLKGTGNTVALGVVVFSTGTATGNDNNTISLCTIMEGATTPVTGIYNSGTATAGIENSSNTISSCNIANFFSASLASMGINLLAGSTSWTITGNRFYQSATRTYTTGNTHKAIGISGTGNGYTVTNNTIGYSAAAGTGTYTMAGTIATRFIGIDISSGTAVASSVQGNTITAISLGSSSGATTANGVLCGINIAAGNVNVGTLSGNTIGAATGTGAISIVVTTTQGSIVGMNVASTGTVSIQNNTMGGFSSTGSTASIAGGVVGIYLSAATTSLTISNNTIGNATANNMVAGINVTTTGSSLASGINIATAPLALTISSNTIQNFVSYGTGTAGFVRGIWTPGVTGSPSVFSITSNTIANLTSNNTNTSAANGNSAAVGINLGLGNNCVISQNTIYNISVTNTGAIGSFAAGITHGNATSTTISRNRIYDIYNASTATSVTAPGSASGIVIRSGTTAINIFNNMISLGTGQTANTLFVGIYSNHGSTPDPIDSVTNNTINITGTATSGAQPSFCFMRGDLSTTARTVTVFLRNNIFTNTRTGGTGKHYAIANNYGATASATGWPGSASNSNVLNAAPATIGYWTSDRDFTAWKNTSGSDALSLSGITVTYVNPASDLHLNMGVTATAMESGGFALPNKATDYDGDARPGPSGSVNGGAIGFDMGADEFDGVLQDIIPPIINYTAIAKTSLTTNRTLTNLASISDISNVNTTAGSKPRIYYKKKGDANDLSGWKYTEAINSSSPFSFIIDYSLLNAGSVSALDTIQYFIAAQDMAPVPNVSIASGSFAATPTSISLTSAAFPIGGALNSYILVPAFSGPYTVGTGGTYTTLKACFDALNGGILTGNVALKVVGDCAETTTATLNSTQEEPAGSNFTLTLTPEGGSPRTISGTIASAAVIKTIGVNRFTIDGLNTGGNSLTVTNLSTTAPLGINISSSGTIPVVNDSVLNVTVNTNLNSGTTFSSIGISCSDQASSLGSGYFNGLVIKGCTVTKAHYGIAVVGGAAAGTNNAVNVLIAENNLAVSGANAIGYCGIVTQGVTNSVIRKNTLGNFDGTANNDDRGIWLAAGTKNTITEQNTLTSIKYMGTGGYGIYGIMVSSNETASNNIIRNNVIADISGDGWDYTSVLADNVHAIFCSGTQTGTKIYNNSINLAGNQSNQTNALATGICLGTGSTADIRNNSIVNNLGLNAATGYGSTAIFLQTGASQLENINYNNYVAGATGSGVKLIGKIGTTDYATLAAWKALVASDSNSISINPLYTALTNLRPTSCSTNNKGTSLAAVTTDYLDSARSITAPDIGAFELTPAAPATPSATTSFAYCINTVAPALTATGTNKLLWYMQPTGGAGDTLAPTPSTLSAGTTTYYVADSNTITGCTSSRLPITVVVSAPVSANTIGPAPATICSGSIPAPISGSTPSGGNGTFVYKWIKSVTDSVSGFGNAGGTDTSRQYAPAAISANTWFKRIVSSGVCGVDTSAVVMIGINIAVSNNTISNVQTICSGTTPAALTGSTPTGGTGSYIYKWLSSTTSATAGYASATGTNNTQGYTPAALSANTWFKRIVSSGACAADTSAAIQVTVNSAVSSNTISNAQSICTGTTPAALTGSTPAGGTGSYAYAWISSTTSATTGYASATGTNNTQGYAPAALSANTWYKRIVSSGVCGADTSAAIQITVNTVVSNNTISNAQTVCSGTTPAALTGSTPTGGTGSYTYAWIRSTTNATTGYASATGTNNTQGYTPAALSTNTWFKRTVSSGACGADTSAAIQITVDSAVSNNTISNAQSICSGTTPAALTGTLPTGGNSSYTYKWISSTTSATTGYASAAGTNNTQGYTPAALSANTWYKRIVSSGSCGGDTSAAIQITVNTVVSNNTISNAQTVCSGTTPAALTGSLPTGGNSSYTYKWMSSTTSATTGYASATGTNNTQGYTPAALSANTWFKRIVSSGACGADTSAAIQITVNSAVSNNTISTAQTICSGTTPAALTGSLPTGATGSYTYAWIRSTTSATTGYASATGTNNTQGYTPAALSANTWFKRIVSSGSCGADTSAAIQITVNSAVSNNTISNSQTICSGTIPAALTGSTPAGGTSSYTYAWMSSTTSATTGYASATGTNNTQGYTPAALSANTWYKRIVSSGACGADTSAAIQITVNAAGTWTGAVSTAWSNTGNWSCPQLPGSATNVIIPTGAPNMPVITDAQQANNITIQTGATLTLNNANAVLSVYGSITNTGTFTNTNGKLNMAGSSAQVLIGGTYSDLQINNTNGVSLGGNITLNDSLVLINGVLTLGNFNLTLANTALASAGSTTSYIKTNGSGNVVVQNVGTAGKTGSVQIPVGNSTYNPVVLANAGTADAFTVWVTDSVTNTYTGSTPGGAKLTANAVNRTWFINEGTAGGSNASVTLQWTTANELSGFNRALSYVARFNGTAWNGTTTAAASGSNPYTQVRTGITAFSPFGVGSGGTLPVELVAFTGNRQQQDAVLNWSTATERNNKGFEVQRSADGKTWNTIAFVKGMGNSASLNRYTYTDLQAFATASLFHYRLKQIDMNGTFVYTTVVSLRADVVSKPEAAVMPNPFNRDLHLDISLPIASDVTVFVSDLSGKVLNKQELHCTEGSNRVALSGVEQLSAGVYFVTIRTANENITHKVIKE